MERHRKITRNSLLFSRLLFLISFSIFPVFVLLILSHVPESTKHNRSILRRRRTALVSTRQNWCLLRCCCARQWNTENESVMMARAGEWATKLLDHANSETFVCVFPSRCCLSFPQVPLIHCQERRRHSIQKKEMTEIIFIFKKKKLSTTRQKKKSQILEDLKWITFCGKYNWAEFRTSKKLNSLSYLVPAVYTDFGWLFPYWENEAAGAASQVVCKTKLFSSSQFLWAKCARYLPVSGSYRWYISSCQNVRAKGAGAFVEFCVFSYTQYNAACTNEEVW